MMIFPTYKNIFNDDIDDVIQSLSTSYPSVFIKIVASISSQLYFSQEKYEEANSNILNRYFKRALMTPDGRKILKWISQYPQTNVLISNYTITELYKILLNNNNDNYPEYVNW
jgi:transglutaminase/protease-like cytokinesis protein 3